MALQKSLFNIYYIKFYIHLIDIYSFTPEMAVDPQLHAAACASASSGYRPLTYNRNARVRPHCAQAAPAGAGS